jgi:hypothetical protein
VEHRSAVAATQAAWIAGVNRFARWPRAGMNPRVLSDGLGFRGVPQRHSLFVGHCHQRLSSAPFSVPDYSVAFSKRGQHSELNLLAGAPGRQAPCAVPPGHPTPTEAAQGNAGASDVRKDTEEEEEEDGIPCAKAPAIVERSSSSSSALRGLPHSPLPRYTVSSTPHRPGCRRSSSRSSGSSSSTGRVSSPPIFA